MTRSSRYATAGRCIGAAALGAVAGIMADRALQALRPRRHVVQRPSSGLPRPGTAAFARMLAHLVREPRSEGNLTAVHDGQRSYVEAVLSAVDHAEESIWFEMFWWHEGRFSDAVADHLVAAAGRNVDVRVLVDGVGADAIGSATFARMRDAGIRVAVFRPVRPWRLRKMNNRTHRRILVVDGRLALTGGIGIGDEWLGEAGRPPWADMLLEVQGPAARDLAALFADHWRLVTGDPVAARRVFARDDRPGGAPVQVLSGGPEDGAQHMRTGLLVAIAAARRRLRAVSPYFVPDDLIIEELVRAARRGVAVAIVVPSGHIDRPVVRHASRHLWKPLLEAGVQVFEYQPTMIHAKALVVDDAWTTVGSLNLDERSFRLNAEVAVATEDAATVRAVNACIDGYVRRSVRISAEDWRRRPIGQRTADGLASMLRVQL